MSGTWLKIGRIYDPSVRAAHPKLLTHAANPLPVQINGSVYRCFFCSRDSQQRSSVGAVDIDIEQNQIVQEFHEPFFVYGPEGSFYADGVSIGSCYVADGKRYMLFMGWRNPTDSHWRGEIGRLVVTEDLKLELESSEPFMPLSERDPISLSYPWVLQDSAMHYQMWFGSTQTWDAGNGEMLHTIEHATSTDGHHWTRTPYSIPHKLGVAQAFSKPTVVRCQDNEYQMWFSYRSGSGSTYRIGHAKSQNCLDWTLDLNSANLSISPSGWDSEMVEYPFVFKHKEKLFMLYNGNNYGRTGFGVAVLKV